MISLETVGKKYFPNYGLKVFLKEDDLLNSDLGYGERFKIVFAEEGSGILNIEGKRLIFVSPALFCFNENEHYFLESHSKLKALTVWFHPSIINNAFSFNRIRNPEGLSPTENQDLFWLEVFIDRNSTFRGQLSIGPGTCKQVKALFDCIKLELDVQSDNYWPCRSRSYLIELLFLIQRLASTPEANYSIEINREQSGIGDILLYLYSNYSKKITIEDLTEKFHINRTSLNKLFNDVTGMSVVNFLIKYRACLSAQLLRDTTLPVAEIIGRTGFNDPSHFGRMFKKYYGLSATEYREKNNWMLK